MLKKSKNAKGFTLVEVIVVAVIVAILAAAAIPLYLGYVHSSRQNVVNNTAGSLAGFCNANRNSFPGATSISETNDPAGTVINGAQGSTWIVPDGMIASVNATNVTITSADDNTITKSVKY